MVKSAGHVQGAVASASSGFGARSAAWGVATLNIFQQRRALPGVEFINENADDIRTSLNVSLPFRLVEYHHLTGGDRITGQYAGSEFLRNTAMQWHDNS